MARLMTVPHFLYARSADLSIVDLSTMNAPLPGMKKAAHPDGFP